ncbi:hypothetical protein [Streptomyces sp. NPDC051677]|uniref:hypothetical protein n=1 Tax=Streptomyces sp. NPDC051677 TaxID=3365669 RepID=UPI0037D28355
MSTPGENAEPQVRPNVYHPYEAADPTSYEEYRDPAAAHGWENAYDQTTELPRVVPAQAEPGGRADRRRAARRTGGRCSRRVIVAAGAVSLAAAIAGYAGLSSGDAPGGKAGTGRPDGGSVAPTGAGSPQSGSGTPRAESGAAPAETSSSSSAAPSSVSPSAVTDPGRSTSSPTAASDTPAPTTPTATAANGGRGHGRGGIKRR